MGDKTQPQSLLTASISWQDHQDLRSKVDALGGDLRAEQVRNETTEKMREKIESERKFWIGLVVTLIAVIGGLIGYIIGKG